MTEQRFKPKYLCWYVEDFYASPRVARRLNWLQRHLYLMLCQQAMYCDTRPYLPSNDADLALLADCPDDVWAQHRESVLSMFTEYTGDEGEVLGWSHPRILADWDRQIEAHKKFVESGRKGGLRQAEGRLEGGQATEQKTEPNRSQPNTTEREVEDNQTESEPKPNGQASGSGSAKAAAAAASSGVVQGSGANGRTHQERGGAGKTSGDEQAERFADLDTDDFGDPLPKYPVRRLLDYFYDEQKKGKLLLGRPDDGDEMVLESLIANHGGQEVGLAMEWAISRSDFWGKKDKGALDGIHGFSRAFNLIADQRKSWLETARKNRRK